MPAPKTCNLANRGGNLLGLLSPLTRSQQNSRGKQCQALCDCVHAVTGTGAHPQQLVGAVGGTDGQLLEQLHHEAAEAAEGARQAHLRVHLDQHVPRCVHVQGLQATGCAPSACAPAGRPGRTCQPSRGKCTLRQSIDRLSCRTGRPPRAGTCAKLGAHLEPASLCHGAVQDGQQCLRPAPDLAGLRH